ncbi:MAG: 3-deoxy-7-phosphoheptulonate synthase, partial [Treponema sp.]|nr:3-deoxy-7-phosphoheptulonate synthase [Treponema sp.]
MIVALKEGTSRSEAEQFAETLKKEGVAVHFSEGASRIVLGLVGDTTAINGENLMAHHLVEK